MLNSALLQVLSEVRSGGSGTGVSHYGLRCGKKAQLLSQLKAQGQIDPGSFASQVGTLVHKLLEYWYAGKLDQVVLPINDMADFENDPVQEALRVFAGYRSFFHQNEWEVIDVECQIPTTDDLTMTQLVDQAVGVSPFTCRLDAIVRIKPEHLENLKSTRGIPLEPGVYIVDHKTMDKKDANAQLRYDMSPQFIAYQMAYNVAFGAFDGELCKGVIANVMVRHKDLTKRDKTTNLPNSFQTFFISPPSEVQEESVRNWLGHKKDYLAQGRPELSSCFDYGPCHFLTNGSCNRV